MGRIVAIGLLSIAVFGCAGVQEKRSAPVAVTMGPSCPTVETDVPPELCEGLPEGYGLSRHAPVEWGLPPATGITRESGPMPITSLYYGRLLCSDGSHPTILSRSMGGVPPSKPTSPRSPRPKVSEEAEDILDFWKVQCGDTLVRMYANTYRCGSVCPPAPFKVMPAAAWNAHVEALALQDEGKEEEALPLHEQSVSIYGESLRLHEFLIFSYMNNKQSEKALEHIDVVLQKFPNAKRIAVLRPAALRNLDRLEEAHQALTTVLQSLHPDDDVRPRAFCYRATIYAQEGATKKAVEAAMLSCKMGFEDCCLDKVRDAKGKAEPSSTGDSEI